MSNIDRAADIIDAWTKEGNELNECVGSPHDIASRLALAGLLAPDLAWTLSADTLEYGVADAAGDIVWFPVDATVGTAEDARQDAVNYANSDQFFRLVARRVSPEWVVTDE